MSEQAEKIGGLDARVRALEEGQREIKDTVQEIRDAVIGARGAWKIIIAIGTAIAAVIGIGAKAFAWFKGAT